MGGDAPLMMIDCVALMSCNHRNDTTRRCAHGQRGQSQEVCESAPSLRTLSAHAHDGRA